MPMKRPTLLLLVILITIHGASQALIILPGPGSDHDLQFNPQFIERNNITTITGQRMIKRDGQPMREEGQRYLYRFGPKGLPVYTNNSQGRPGSGSDTTSTTFSYDTAGRVERRLRHDMTGYFAYDAVLDKEGRPVRETYSRIENLSTEPNTLVPGKVTEISDEYFRYETVNDSTTKKLFTNNLGLPFREQLFRSNALGYLVQIEDRYLISNRRSRVTFRYDEKGRLMERVEQPDLDHPRTTKRTWNYDAAGNVIDGMLWHDDRAVEREEYLYDNNTMELTARLAKDLASGIIHVVRFRTERR